MASSAGRPRARVARLILQSRSLPTTFVPFGVTVSPFVMVALQLRVAWLITAPVLSLANLFGPV
jgi:hypothetical protein